MGDRTAPILKEMDAHRERFEAFCRLLSPQELATPIPDSPRTVRDYIAHLCTIDGLICRLMGPAAGIMDMPIPEVAPPIPFDIDDWNAAIVARRKNSSIDDLFAEAARHRANYIRMLQALPDERMEMVIPFGGDRKTLGLAPTTARLGDLLSFIALHDPEHTRDILRALPGREPEVREWIVSADFDRVPAAIKAQRV